MGATPYQQLSFKTECALSELELFTMMLQCRPLAVAPPLLSLFVFHDKTHLPLLSDATEAPRCLNPQLPLPLLLHPAGKSEVAGDLLMRRGRGDRFGDVSSIGAVGGSFGVWFRCLHRASVCQYICVGAAHVEWFFEFENMVFTFFSYEHINIYQTYLSAKLWSCGDCLLLWEME